MLFGVTVLLYVIKILVVPVNTLLLLLKIRVELMLLYLANEIHTINVLVLVGILNARFIFTIATTKLFARIIFRAVLIFAHPAQHEF